jgi:hypothetical protein
MQAGFVKHSSEEKRSQIKKKQIGHKVFEKKEIIQRSWKRVRELNQGERLSFHHISVTACGVFDLE